MKLRDLKEWVNELPDEFLEYDVVNAEVGKLLTMDDIDEMEYRLDKPVVALYIDETTKEFLILNEEIDVNSKKI